MPETAAQVVLGVDYGTRKIGVAVIYDQLGAARPLTVLRASNRGALWRELDALIATWQPDRLVIGLPLTAAGGETPMAHAARRFAAALAARYALAVELHDERLTSRTAGGVLAAARRGGQRAKAAANRRDAVAAAAILDSWHQESLRAVAVRPFL